ncbi:hypothetical protein U9M48_012967 [Paspalum notatum var. saurae]|uniref:Uncharacterized protein n=1 Tax=Paspalum notatum var. saurae TaxID=547442 RepID=A0AAQ3WJB1_PASNO
MPTMLGCRIDRKSTSGTCQLLGTSLVSWSSRKQATKNPVLQSRTKHIDVRFHFLRDHCEKGDIDLVHVASENQLADIFTKPLEFGTFVRLRGAIHVGDAFFSLIQKNKLTLDMVTGWRCIDNALIKGEIESQWTDFIALLR